MVETSAGDRQEAVRGFTSRGAEIVAFLVLAFGIWPVVAVGVVGGFGFLVWMWQIVFGPPGPPPSSLH